MKVEQVSTDKVIPYARNARKISDVAVSKVAASIKEFGWQQPIVVDKEGVIIVGHTRLLAAKALELDKVPVHVAHGLTEAQVKAYRIADNRTGEESLWDNELLAVELGDIKGMDDYLVEMTGWDDSQLEDLMGVNPVVGDQTVGDDVAPEPVEEGEPDSRPGEVYELGPHRLMCGDSTDPEQVATLMDGQKADMVFTDPPYGVGYVGKTKDALTIKSDEFDEEKLAVACKGWFDNVDLATIDGAYLMATVPPGPLHLVFAGDWKERGWLRQIMVWNKSSMVLGHSEYHYKHEPILFGWKPGNRLKNADRTKTTVWDFDKPSSSREHPTMKPVEMWCYGITNHTKSGGILFEPFGGSGTTMIACAKTGRVSRLMELDPKYCDVIRRRWTKWANENGHDVGPGGLE